MNKQPLSIEVRGAREHNLKNISLSIPKNKITVITGLSGSGKSSLAFDTVYAEGQRRYMDSLSVYARHFLDQIKKPDIDSITGLSPAIAIDQKTISNSPRSTVGTVTEIYDFLRLLFAKIGTPHCPKHKIPVEGQLPEQIIESLLDLKKGTKVILSSPVAREKKGEFTKEFKKWAKLGFVSAIIDGEQTEITDDIKLNKNNRHNIDIIVDKIIIDAKYKVRISESVHKALSLSKGQAKIQILNGEEKTYSIHHSCPQCSYSFPDIDPLIFSFNNPKGACSTCNGLGTPDVVEYEEETLTRGDKVTRVKQTKWKSISKKSKKDDEDIEIEQLRVCKDCAGTGLNEKALNIFLGQNNISDLASLSIKRLREKISSLKLNKRDLKVSEKIIEEIKYRLTYLETAGAGYLSLDRRARSLSGGEAQRIRLASQVSTPLIGVLYVLDEPSIGLHPKDHQNILKILKEIKDRGNTVIVVEHDEDTIRSADFVIDVGPGAGVHGGTIMAAGTPQELQENQKSLTGQYLSKSKQFPYPTERRGNDQGSIQIQGASGNNLKEIDVEIPVGCFTVITGVSGSGKSSLIMDTLLPYALNHLKKTKYDVASVKSITGLEKIERVASINQKPIGRTPRSCPATYVGLFPQIRDLFASLPEARMRGYRPGHFSFNVKGGRCEICQGAGMIKTSMHFLADSLVPCDTCHGRRYSQETLLIRYKEKNIADVLEMSSAEALEFFENHNPIRKKLQFLVDVGLGYICLGQNSKTLSGGEAQRIKLARELSKQVAKHTLFILDEPTTGLHIHDTAKLVQILHRLVDSNNTVVVIEHNLDLIYSADYIVDLGPDGGESGGEVITYGKPESILKSKGYTKKYLKSHLSQ